MPPSVKTNKKPILTHQNRLKSLMKAEEVHQAAETRIGGS